MDLEILNIASDTDNNRDIKNHTHFSKLKNSLCGDEMLIKLIIKNEKIVDFGYQGKSCVYCQASASLLSKISINNKKKQLNELCDDVKSYFDGNLGKIDKKWLFLRKLLKKKNFSRKECLLLPFKTLKKIVSN
tara:strand:+ start:6788 stop:7186 length:399 start_codon:yes stop_codon:yes gene_type:complete